MSRAPLLTLLAAVAAFVALPLSLHFEGNDGTAEPFLYILPAAVVIAGAGTALSLRKSPWLAGFNLIAAGVISLFWVWLVTYRGD